MRSGIPRIIPIERPCAVLGISCGGQLAKMTVLAAEPRARDRRVRGGEARP